MALDDIVNVTITATTASPSRPGFGTPLVAAYFPSSRFGGARVRSYTSLAGMVSDGFAVTDPAYLAAQAAFAQNPRPVKVKVGRRALPTTQSLKLQCMSATQGDIYTLTVGTQAPVSYTVGASATTTTVATAIAALITGGGATASAATDTITLAPTVANTLVDVKNWSSNFHFTDASADPGIATDLAAIYTEDSDWYALALDSNSKAEVLAAAAWVEANKRLFVSNSSDYGCKDSTSTTDVMATLKSSSYARSGSLFSGKQLLSFSGMAWTAKQLTATPGSDNWAFKTLAGVPVDSLTSTESSAIKAKNGNSYVTVAGLNVTQNGMSGAGEYFDIARFIDWLQAQIQINVFAALANTAKIPFTNGGVDVIVSIIQAALAAGVNAGGLVKGSTSVTAPDVATVSTVDKNARNLPDVSFTGTLAGAINTLVISGVLST